MIAERQVWTRVTRSMERRSQDLALIVFAGEKVREEYLLPTPDVAEPEPVPDFPVPTLDALVRMKLTSFRIKDKVHLMDLLDVGLIDETWCGRLPPEIAVRLQELFDEPHREG